MENGERLEVGKAAEIAHVCGDGFEVFRDGSLGAYVPLRKSARVSGWLATHWSKARALHTRFEAWLVSEGGDKRGYMDTISCSSAGMTPNECHKIGAQGTFSQNLASARSHGCVFIQPT